MKLFDKLRMMSLILLLGFVIIPAYAQQFSPVIVEPVIVEEQQNVLDELFNLIIISVIASVIGSFVGGSVLGFVFSNKIENDRERKELAKLHSLIKSDFSSINRFINNKEISVKSYQNAFKNGNYAEQIINEYATLTPESHLSPIYGKFVKDVKAVLVFTYKNTIELNGLLIKLDADEIKIVQVTYDTIVKFEKLSHEDWDIMLDKLPRFKVGMKLEDKIKQVNFHALHYLKQTLETIESVREGLENVNTIEWMSLNSEIKLPKVEQRINDSKKSKK